MSAAPVVSSPGMEPLFAPATLRATPDTLATGRTMSADRAAGSPDAPPRLKGYAIAGILGRGSFAVVWRGVQTRTRRPVAIKVFRRDSAVNSLLVQREVELLIRLDKHPNIVSLLDADLSGLQPFYVMELVEGGSLQSLMDTRIAVGPDRVATWMTEMASALTYVHARGIVHCDFKPANVLLDGDGRVRVADFGQARVARASGRTLGTLGYMAPEQAVPAAGDTAAPPSPAWDVYGLGATVFGALTGRAPHADTMRRLSPGDVDLEERLRVYRDVAGRSPLRVGGSTWRGGSEAEFHAIVNRCLEIEPGRRYGSMAAVAEDLAIRARGGAIRALRANPFYRARKIVRRSRGIAMTVGAAGLVLLAMLVYFRSARTGDRAGVQLQRAHRLVEAGDLASAALYYAEVNRLKPSDLARENTLASLARIASRPVFTVPGGSGEPLALDAVRGRVAAVGRRGDVMVWTMPGSAAGGLELRHRDDVTAAAFSPDGRLIATGCRDGTLRVWQVTDGKQIGDTLRLGGRVSARGIAFSPDGRLGVVGCSDGTAQVWNARTSRAVGGALRHGSAVTTVTFHPNGLRVGTGTADGRARIWDISTGQQTGDPIRHPESIQSMAFDAAGGRLATGCQDGRIRFWEPATGRSAGSPLPAGEPALVLAFSPGRGLLATGGAGGKVRLWDAATNEPVGPGYRHRGPVQSCGFGREGTVLMTAGRQDRTVRSVVLEALLEAISPDQLILRVQLATRRRLRADGEAEAIPAADWKLLKRRAAAGQAGDHGP